MKKKITMQQNSSKTYNCHYAMFTRFIAPNTLTTDITSDTIDEFVLYLKSNTSANDITVTT